ncbi:MAG: glutathione transferase [Pseudomonadota bacterium]|nr:glutathione transferase [Pseudomonadota bacterium]
MFTLTVDAQYASPYALAVFVTLLEKNLPFSMQKLDLSTGAQRTQVYCRASLTQRVPLLADGNFSLSESSAIIEYLQDTYPAPSVLPHPPRHRARARQVQAWLRSDLLALRHDRSTEVVFYRPCATPLSPSGQADADKLIRIANQLLGKRLQLFDDWCIADTELALALGRLVFQGDAVPAHLQAYVYHQWQRPSVQEWVSQQRPPLP